jgi:hypothetical protein
MKKVIYVLLLALGIILNIDAVKAEVLEVDTFEELKEAIVNEAEEIAIIADFEFTEKLTITKDLKINGNNKVLTRNSAYKGNFITISGDVTLSITDLTIDGGAPGWKMDYDNYFYTGANNTDYVRVPTINVDTDVISSASLISNSGNLNLNGVTLQNNRATVNGAVISGIGNNNITNSKFIHNGSSKAAGALYPTGGKTVVDGSQFIENVAGVGVTNSQSGGAIYANGATMIEIKNNTIFESNFAQGNAGALYINKSSVLVKDSTFRKNAVGNDGAAISISSTRVGDTAYFENVVLEGNKGYAITSQSMGIVWIDNWTVSTEENPITFKNCTAFDNVSGTGVFTDKNESYVSIEDCKIYNNNMNVGAAIYSQSGHYNITNTTIHDNSAANHTSVIYFRNPYVSMNLDNVSIYNNKTVGTGAITLNGGGTLNIKNSEIYGNETKKGTIAVMSQYADNPATITIENTKVHSNTAVEEGGGIYIKNSAGVYTSLVIDDSSKIYDNKAGIAGDDFVYIREDSGTDADNDITLNNAGLMGIVGIDGLYHDNQDDRFATTENPKTFENYVHYNDGSIYLKAAGVSELEYDLNGGQSKHEYLPVKIKYGEDFILISDIPNKSNGEKFVGWNTKEDGTGTWLYAGDKYDGSEGFLLYAQYEAENPNTLDDIYKYIIMLLIASTASLIMIFKYIKKAHN